MNKLLMFILIIASTCLGGKDQWPDAVYKYSCTGKDKSNVWKMSSCSDMKFITIDCDGNIWWLTVSGTDQTSSVIQEQILYSAKEYKEACKIVEDTIEQHNLKTQRWFE